MEGTFALSGLDYAVMLLYAVGIIGYGLYSAKAQSSEEYFLAGRDMTWPIVGISLFAANISSSTLVGLAGDAYKTNTQVFNYEWLASVVLVFFAIFFLPFYLRSRVYTMPEFLERRYNRASRYYFSAITIVGNVLIDTAAGLYVGTVVLKLLFPELSTFAIVAILALASAAYTIPGGLNSVIQTEVIQAILLVFGSCLITYFAFERIDGWEGLIQGLDALGAAGELPQLNGYDFAAMGVDASLLTQGYDPDAYDAGRLATMGLDSLRMLTGEPTLEYIRATDIYQPQNAEEVLSLVRPIGETPREILLGTGGDGFMPWTGLLLGAPILGFYFWANNQFMVQRVLGAKDLDHGRWGALFAGLLKLPVLFIMDLPGTAAILLFNDLDISSINYQLPGGGTCENLADCPNATYPLLLFELLPRGILGLVLAGLLAAMMSSVSATFNSASTLITMDFVKQFRPDLSSQQLVRVGQISTLVLVVAACLWAPQIERFSSLFEYLQIILSFIAPPVAAAFIAGLFSKRVNGTGAFSSLLFGAGLTIVFLFFELSDSVNWMTEMHFLHRPFYLFVLCLIVNFVVSHFTDNEPSYIRETVDQGAATPTDTEYIPFEEKIRDYTWSREIIDAETEELRGVSWYKNYRIQAVGLLIITAILVAYFW